MTSIEVHELGEKMSKILHQAQESGEAVEVTEHGAVLAFLVPIRGRQPEEDGTGKIDLDVLAARIGAYLPEKVDAVEAIREIRREL